MNISRGMPILGIMILVSCCGCGSFLSESLFRSVVGGRADGWCSGAWIVFPSYMVYVFGREILQGLGVASGTGGSEEDDIARKER